MRFITLDNDNIVVAIREARTIVEGEIQSDIGELGQIIQEDGTFITPEIEPSTPKPTIEEIRENQIILMAAIADMYEDMISKGTV